MSVFNYLRNCKNDDESDNSDDNLKIVLDTPPRARTPIEPTEREKQIIDSIEDELEKRLEEKAAKTNLNANHVKSIIKHIVTNEHVLAMIRKLENPNDHDESGFVYEPKLTRSKAKELLSSSPELVTPIVPLSPIPWITKKKSSKTQVLLSDELQDDSSGDEYIPHKKDWPINLRSNQNVKANNKYNVKTLIHLINIINNTNIIDTPILVDNKNKHEIDLKKPNTPRYEKRHRVSNNTSSTCCNIVHPQECYKSSPVLPEVCFTRKHFECSKICINSTNLLIRKVDTPSDKCVSVLAFPYQYCRFFELEDCSECYNCKDVDEVECTKKESCSDSCRKSIFPARFYNRPYHLRNSLGDQSSLSFQ